MNRKITACLIALSSILTTSFSVFSAEEIEVAVDYTTNTVTVSGDVGGMYADRYVLLQILNPGKTDIFTQEDALNWSDQARVSSDGSYSFSMSLNTVGGTDSTYTAVISVDGAEKVLKKTFELYSISYVDDVFKRIEAAKRTGNSSALWEIIKTEYQVFGVTENEYYAKYTAMTEAEQKTVCGGMLNQPVSNVVQFVSALEDAVKTAELNKITDWQEYAQEMLSICSMSQSSLSDYNSYPESEQERIIKELMNTKYSYSEELTSAFNQMLMMNAFSTDNIVLWTDMYSALERYNDVLKLDFSDYNKLQHKNKVMQAMLGITYTNTDSIVNKFYEEVKKQMNEEAKSGSTGSSGGSGGGSSGGGGGGSIRQPSISSGAMVPLAPGSEDTPANPQTDIFTDISDYAWAKDGITELYTKNIISGYDDGSFRPGINVTRAEFVKMLVLALNIDVSAAEEKSGFGDVSEDMWHYDYINAAWNIGLVTGDDNGMFNPDSSISREDIAVIVYRYINDASNTKSFDDINLCSDYSRQAVEALGGAGIINGFEDNTFRPKSNASRAETAVLLMNVINYLKEDK